jgi:LPXTG-motif cell wall-anchored protein
MRTLTRAGALCSVAAAALLAAVPSAFATGDDTYTVQLRQPLPRTATDADGAAPQESRDECPGVPDGQDGWHFVLPGNSTDFVKLTVTFEPGGQQVVTDFGPPSDKHAYVWSQAGAELTSAVAEVRGGELEKFNLSHTCPATSTTTPSATPSGSSEPSATPSASESTGGTESPAASPSPSGTGAEEAPAASSSPSSQGDVEGDLAETGSSAPVGLLGAVAAVLVAAGGFLVYRRRKA